MYIYINEIGKKKFLIKCLSLDLFILKKSLCCGHDVADMT